MTTCQACTAPSEQWRPVVGLEGFVEVSDHGQARSLDRVVWIEPTHRSAGYWRTHKGKILKQSRHRERYMYISLHGGGVAIDNAKVHHLVLIAFVGPCPPDMECCHANDIPDDNHLENLRWDTRRANVLDAVRNGKRLWDKCSRGHEYTPENTYRFKNGGRRCRECALRLYRERQSRLREAS